jgi:hypothetical protein
MHEPGGYQADSINAIFSSWTKFLAGTSSEYDDIRVEAFRNGHHLLREEMMEAVRERLGISCLSGCFSIPLYIVVGHASQRPVNKRYEWQRRSKAGMGLRRHQEAAKHSLAGLFRLRTVSRNWRSIPRNRGRVVHSLL